MDSPQFLATADRHDAATFCFVFNPGQESSSSACSFYGTERLYVCVLELLPISAQSFRLFLLLLFFKFWFNILNSGGCPCIIKAPSPFCLWLQKWRTPQRLLCLAVKYFVPWLCALKLNPFKMRWKCCCALPLPIKWLLHFLLQPALLLFQLWQHLQMLSMEQTPTVPRGACYHLLLHGKRLHQLYGQWYWIQQRIQCLPLFTS